MRAGLRAVDPTSARARSDGRGPRRAGRAPRATGGVRAGGGNGKFICGSQFRGVGDRVEIKYSTRLQWERMRRF